MPDTDINLKVPLVEVEITEQIILAMFGDRISAVEFKYRHADETVIKRIELFPSKDTA